jgi:1-deoxy-D-xylulose-5-phosphate synthase
LLILAVGSGVDEAVCAAALLSENHQIQSTVVNARFIKPLDEALILPLADSIGRVITIEENTLAGGFGSGILEILADHGMGHVHVKRLGVNDRFVEHGPQNSLRCDYGLDAAAIVKAALEILGQKESELLRIHHN